MDLITGDDVSKSLVLSAKKRRTQIYMLRNHGLSVQEIAEQLGISRQRVHDLYRRAKKELDSLKTSQEGSGSA